MASATVPLLDDDDTLAFGEEDDQIATKNKLRHPYVTVFHLVFRFSALFLYVFSTVFIDGFITTFVIIVLLLSMDFWTVKNITGRLMVGLRWWNYVDDEGTSHWVFESRKNRIHPSEAGIFWTALIGVPVLWLLLFPIALFTFKFKWLLLVCIALALNGANLYGYTKCKLGSSGSSFSSFTSDLFRRQVIQNMSSFVTRTSQPPTTGSPPTNVV
ncbi:putative Golgi apparatus membrane protein-like protein CG5021 isoform X2 [Lycorma delicatula]|uniref:putative Golgi apparatus membrane protein-like protein CG5021 isoform X2 n=1 Tax=Lycorma delicatula TaxID=130591 RepID=UPI003F5193DF